MQKLKGNNAKWHKSCKDQFSNLKLQRAEKRKTESLDNHGTEKAARHSLPQKAKPLCFFVKCVQENFTGLLHLT